MKGQGIVSGSRSATAKDPRWSGLEHRPSLSSVTPWPPTAALASAASPLAKALGWVVVFCSGMVAAGPPHHAWAWLAIVPFTVNFWRALMRLAP